MVAASPVVALLVSPWEALLASAGLDSPSLPASDFLASAGSSVRRLNRVMPLEFIRYYGEFRRKFDEI